MQDKQLTEKLGVYTLEAMQRIDNENAKNMAIVLSDSASEKEKQQVLNLGIWYTNDYLVCVKKYPTRFSWLLAEEVHQNGFLSKKFWQPVKEKGFIRKPYTYIWKDPNLSPAEEITNIVEGKSLCLLGCATVFNIAQYAALLRIVGKNRFDRIFSGKEPFTLPLRISDMLQINPIYLFLSGKIITDLSVINVGDKIGIRNHSDYKKKHPVGPAQGWNIVCSEVNPEIKFRGFGFGKNLTVAEVKQLLINEYNRVPFHDPMVFANIPNQNSNIASKISQEDFETNQQAGFDFQLVMLDPIKVKMIMDADENSVNLLEVFKNTASGPAGYAMESDALSQWKSAIQSSATNKPS